MIFFPRVLLAAAALAFFAGLAGARADEIKNPTAVYAGLDKITGRIVRFDVAIDETVQFGTLQITPRACYSKPATETPQTVSFLQVDELTAKSKLKRIFSGWMFAASPGLNGIEHPVYDVWLLDCKGGVQTVPDVAAAPGDQDGDAVAPPAAIPSATTPAISAPSAAKPRRATRAATAPAFTGPPIEVGNAPGDGPGADAVAPPGPLSPDLAPPPRSPTRKYYPATEDDTAPADQGPDQGPY